MRYIYKWMGKRRFVLFFCLVNTLLFLLVPDDVVSKCASGRGMEWYAPFVFHFFHASWWHLAINSLAFLVLNPPAWVIGVGWVTAGTACMVPMAWGAPTLYTHTFISDIPTWSFGLGSLIGDVGDYGGMGVVLASGDGWELVSSLTVGCSAMYFSVLSKWYVERGLDMGWLLFLLLLYGMIPMVNWGIHIISFVFGLMVWRLIKFVYTKIELGNRYFWGRLVDGIHLTNDVKRK